MRQPIKFFVAGIPKPAGSKRGFYIPKLKRVVITDANPNSRDWKTDVKYAATRHFRQTADLILTCPLQVSMTFIVQRPSGHFRTGKFAGQLRESAPTHPAVKPDVLKLARGVEDALTGVIWRDDSLIVQESLRKEYGANPGCLIEITEAK